MMPLGMANVGDVNIIKKINGRDEVRQHLPLDRAEQDFQNSAFYKLLMNPDTNLWRDDTEENFRRLQNEIEYGAWNRNERGEIAE